MRKLYSLRDKILFTGAVAGDIFHYVATMSERDRYNFYYNCYYKEYKRKSFLQSWQHLMKTGDMEKIVEKGKAYYQLTGRGREKINKKFPVLDLARQKWDGKWRMVIFDVPNIDKKKRDRLRHKLKQLGFGMWQESVYISPHSLAADLHESLEVMGMLQYTVIAEVKQLEGVDFKEVAAKVWKLEDLNWKYSQWSCDAEDFLQQEKKTEQQKQELLMAYEALLLTDPGLPAEILPEDWEGERASALFKNCFYFTISRDGKWIFPREKKSGE